jgi:hypothetical protein
MQDECRYRDYSAVNGQDIATVVAERIMFCVRDISTEHFKVRSGPGTRVRATHCVPPIASTRHNPRALRGSPQVIVNVQVLQKAGAGLHSVRKAESPPRTR